RRVAADRPRPRVGAARPARLPHRRAVRQEAREAQAVGMILRLAESDADLDAWRRVRMAVVPNERAPSVEELRRVETPGRVLLLAELDGELAGSGLASRSEMAGLGSLAPRVLPQARRRGVGTALREAP